MLQLKQKNIFKVLLNYSKFFLRKKERIPELGTLKKTNYFYFIQKKMVKNYKQTRIFLEKITHYNIALKIKNKKIIIIF